ncbi:MAG: MBL fold metallo-hydrolase [Sulfolobales archaeon]
MIRLYFLGLGGWASNPLMSHTSVLLTTGHSRILIDAGECIYSSLRICTPFDVGDIDYIIITHRHGDHLLGLPTFLQHAKRLGIKVRVLGPYDVYYAIKELLEGVGIHKYISLVDFTVIEDGSRLNLNDVTVSAVSALHTVPALMYRFDVNDKCVAYSGDSSPNPGFSRMIEGCDVLIHEASIDDDFRNDALKHGHSTIGDAIRIAEEAKVKRLVLVHRGLKPLTLSHVGVPILLVQRCDALDV